MTQRNEKNNVVHVDQGLDKHGSYEIYSTNKTLYNICSYCRTVYPPPFLLGSLKDGMGTSPPNKPVCLDAGKECTYMLWSMRSYMYVTNSLLLFSPRNKL